MKAALHIQYIAQEMNIIVPDTLEMNVDATAAIGKIQAPRGGGRMKHIDLRAAWMQLLQNRKICNVSKVDGTSNPADFVVTHSGLTQVKT